MDTPHSTPLWMKILIILIMLPVAVIPFIAPGTAGIEVPRLLMWFYPAYVFASGICAWIVYPQRPEVAWILLILLCMSHAAMYCLM